MPEDTEQEKEHNDANTEQGISADQPWYKTIVDTYKKYKEDLFGDFNAYMKHDRMLDYTVPPNYKFVFAKYKDNSYRPASIVGKSKKMKSFIIYFYHTKKCRYLEPKDILLKHGNLLDRKVSFSHEGQKKKGIVYGNNSPANHGTPSIFYIKRKGKSKWYSINFKKVYLTKRQFNNLYFTRPKRRMSTSTCRKRSGSSRDNGSRRFSTVDV